MDSKISSAISDVRGTESFADSPLEEAGFEPLVQLTLNAVFDFELEPSSR
jgi:hypothetical protein